MGKKKGLKLVGEQDLTLDISDELKGRLLARLAGRHEDDVLDRLEEIDMHRRAIKELVKEINELSGKKILEEVEEK